MNTISETIEKMNSMIESGEEIETFEKYFKILSMKAPFPATTILNEYFYRVRKDEGEFIDHVSKIKYPPEKYAKKGRLNDNGESLAYLSSGEISPLVEIDIGYYQVYCYAKIQYIKKDIFFHLAGVKKDKIKITPSMDNEVSSFYRELLTTRDKKVYNATIALGRILFSSEGFKVGVLYSSVHEDKTNQNLFNIAIKSNDFDECCKIIELEYNILRYVPDKDCILIDNINNGKPLESGEIKWELSYYEMMKQLNEKINGEVFKVNNGIVHYKFGGGHIESETTESFFVRFIQSNNIIEIKKSEVKNI